MLQPMTETKPEAPAAARPELRVFRPDSPYVALGLAVNHLMTKPAFAALRFGEWSRILVGQINRKHYYFVVDAKNQVQGFLGWAITTKDKAEALARRTRRAGLRGQFRWPLHHLQRVGGEQRQGQPLPAAGGTQGHGRQGVGLRQAPLQGRHHADHAPAGDRICRAAPRARLKRGLSAQHGPATDFPEAGNLAGNFRIFARLRRSPLGIRATIEALTVQFPAPPSREICIPSAGNFTTEQETPPSPTGVG